MAKAVPDRLTWERTRSWLKSEDSQIFRSDIIRVGREVDVTPYRDVTLFLFTLAD